MNILAFDTCFGAVSACVRWRSARGEWLTREAYEEREPLPPGGRKPGQVLVGHAERVLPLVESVMEGSGLAFSDLDRLAVTVGPGSFTGLRVGIAAARGLALAARLPLVSATSLAVMAHRADRLLDKKRAGRNLVVAVDAYKSEVYIEVFGENAGESLSPARALPIAAALAIALETAGSGAIFVGNGAPLLAAASTAAGGPVLEVLLPRLEPHARALALIAPFLPEHATVVPLYLRAPDVKLPSSMAAHSGA